jgi:hypothetical protein
MVDKKVGSDWGIRISIGIIALCSGFVLGLIIMNKIFPRETCSTNSKRFVISRENPYHDSVSGYNIATNQDRAMYGIAIFNDAFSLEGLYAKGHLVKIDIFFPGENYHHMPQQVRSLRQFLDSLKQIESQR